MEDQIILICSCSCLNHAIRFSRWEDGQICVDLVLNPERSWYRRSTTAVRYLFNRICNYGVCAEILLTETDKKKLLEWLKKN